MAPPAGPSSTTDSSTTDTTSTSTTTTAQQQPPPPRSRPTLVTGSTGYIGGLLVPRLLAAGHRVRVLVRHPDRIAELPWRGQVEVVTGDATDPAALTEALAGAGVAYYLLHSMDGAGDFVARDRALAAAFAHAARTAGLERLVYLSGLHPEGTDLSDHLASRVEVGEVLLASGVPTAVLQAGVVLGDGSASFDMLRHLAERLPAMIAPRWLDNRIQPIAVADALHHLVAAADLPPEVNRTIDIGGPDVLTYREMMQRYARLTGIGRRLVATVPVLTPGLASHWVGLVTPVPSGVARPLVASLVHDAVVGDGGGVDGRVDGDVDDGDTAADLLGPPPGGATGFDEAVLAATETYDPLAWRRTIGEVGIATLACAVVGGVLTSTDSRWYRSLRLPRWQPPAAVFPVVWTALYSGIALSSAATVAELADSDDPDDVAAGQAFRLALGVNLALNTAWSAVFFRGHAPRAATVCAAALAVSSADLARRAAPLGAGRAAVLGAYAAWCGFATALTGAIARRNR
ncbi:tryptophan-rich sensory protein [Miniimonas sp. S16]|uniref:tryptophan-rich sensory protein n=1 Tax=Miniimonas sp. S16 TaxID=2171623 RepID=UPI000D529401|nr:tryptophan-rich sensory protein [Miniimonas sp. S16]